MLGFFRLFPEKIKYDEYLGYVCAILCLKEELSFTTIDAA